MSSKSARQLNQGGDFTALRCAVQMSLASGKARGSVRSVEKQGRKEFHSDEEGNDIGGGLDFN